MFDTKLKLAGNQIANQCFIDYLTNYALILNFEMSAFLGQNLKNFQCQLFLPQTSFKCFILLFRIFLIVSLREILRQKC